MKVCERQAGGRGSETHPSAALSVASTETKRTRKWRRRRREPRLAAPPPPHTWLPSQAVGDFTDDLPQSNNQQHNGNTISPPAASASYPLGGSASNRLPPSTSQLVTKLEKNPILFFFFCIFCVAALVCAPPTRHNVKPGSWGPSRVCLSRLHPGPPAGVDITT